MKFFFVDKNVTARFGILHGVNFFLNIKRLHWRKANLKPRYIFPEHLQYARQYATLGEGHEEEECTTCPHPVEMLRRVKLHLVGKCLNCSHRKKEVICQVLEVLAHITVTIILQHENVSNLQAGYPKLT